MQRVTISLFLAVLGLSVMLPGSASAARVHQTLGDQTVTFRIHVSGVVPADMTFWAAYGPIADRFGLVQLKQTSAGRFSGAVALPPGQKGIVSYLAGYGVVQTRTGNAPGNPVITIRRTADVLLSTSSLPVPRWSPPQG